jgi:hypothetical protein
MLDFGYTHCFSIGRKDGEKGLLRCILSVDIMHLFNMNKFILSFLGLAYLRVLIVFHFDYAWYLLVFAKEGR